MKEFDKPLQQDNKTIAAEQRQVRQLKHEATINPRPGHKVWEFDLATGEINEASITKVNATSTPLPKLPSKKHRRLLTPNEVTVHKSIERRANCLYASALNKKNALRHFVVMYEELSKAGKIVKQQ